MAKKMKGNKRNKLTRKIAAAVKRQRMGRLKRKKLDRLDPWDTINARGMK